MLMKGEEGNNLVGPRLREILPRRNPPVRHLLRRRNPFATKDFNTNSLMVDDLSSDIALRGLMSSSLLALSPFSPRNQRGSQERSRQEGRGKAAADEEQAKERGEKTLSLLLLKEKGTTVREGHADRGRQNSGAKNPLSFPFNVDETCPDR